DTDLAQAEADPGGQRDEAAWTELHRRVLHYARRFARRAPARTGPDPWLREDQWEHQDIAQEICIKFHARNVLAQLRGARTPVGYLVKMLKNAEADRLRPADARRRVDLDPDALDRIVARPAAGTAEKTPRRRDGVVPQPAAGIAKHARWSGPALQRALAQLSIKDQALYQERYVQGRSVGEIAAALGIKYGAAAARIRRLK